MGKLKKFDYIVHLEIFSRYYYSRDRSVRKLARLSRGKSVGSGYCFHTLTRDHSFTFKTEKSAKKFKSASGRRARVWNIINICIEVEERE